MPSRSRTLTCIHAPSWRRLCFVGTRRTCDIIVCPKCADGEPKKNGDFSKHLRSEHSPQPPPCPLCKKEKWLTTVERLTRHLSEKHGINTKMFAWRQHSKFFFTILIHTFHTHSCWHICICEISSHQHFLMIKSLHFYSIIQQSVSCQKSCFLFTCCFLWWTPTFSIPTQSDCNQQTNQNDTCNNHKALRVNVCIIQSNIMSKIGREKGKTQSK